MLVLILSCFGEETVPKNLDSQEFLRRRNGPTERPTDGRTDGRSDGRTDRPSYRDARTHLKNVLTKKKGLDFGFLKI